jgi:hypothetical protein
VWTRPIFVFRAIAQMGMLARSRSTPAAEGDSEQDERNAETHNQTSGAQIRIDQSLFGPIFQILFFHVPAGSKNTACCPWPLPGP